jgi:hypothetical protein
LITFFLPAAADWFMLRSVISAHPLPRSSDPLTSVWAVVERLATYATALYTKLTAANPPATPRNPRISAQTSELIHPTTASVEPFPPLLLDARSCIL